MYNEEENKEVEKQEETSTEQLVIDDDMTTPRRLHPAAMFFNFIKLIKDTILGLGIGLIVTFQNLFFISLFSHHFSSFFHRLEHFIVVTVYVSRGK